MEESCNPINETIDFLLSLLSSDEIIPEDPFFEQVGVFSKKLKDLLTIYFDLSAPDQIPLQPYLNYYRQLQGYLVFLLRFPTILQIPHHSEIEQTLDFIRRKDELILKDYSHYSENERELLHGSFKEKLERLWGTSSDIE